MAKAIVETPLMKQYIAMKQQHPDAILLFRVGDFYETFSDDAVSASEILGITLTKRANGSAQYVELAGFPHHALDTYLPKLVRAGKRVAICEQLEDPKATRKLVERGITELVTPGVSINDNVLNHKENNFLAAIHFGKQIVGVSFLDISTGEFLTAEGTIDYIEKLMANFAPKEVLVERGKKRIVEESFSEKYYTFELDDWVFTSSSAMDRLLKQFETSSLKGFGVHSMSAGIIASGAVLHYLDITQHTHTGHITSLARVEEEMSVRLDRFTIRNLELVRAMSEDGKSLLDIIDRTVSPMGARLLHRWLLFPLKDSKEINKRLDIVEYFFKHTEHRDILCEKLAQVGDLERLIGKVSASRVNPRELCQLRNALLMVTYIKDVCIESGESALVSIGEQLNPCSGIADKIGREI
ncbi:MAG: DNA mismatch repair protein MutS, partial [Duncaniella sp.]|nr:DNA mismatch repair protein MutS [Duncaniella sp.]